MANALYPKARQAFARGELSWDDDDIRLVLLDATYTYDVADEFLDIIDGGSVVATSDVLTAKDSVDGILDAADVLVAAVTGDQITQVVVYQDSGSPATSHVILYYDSNAASVLIEVDPDGGNVRVRWSDGPLKMARI